MNNRVYILGKNYDHLLDMDFDATHVPFTDDQHFMAMISSTMTFELPKMIYCEANYDCIPKYDFPIVDIADAVFSERLFGLFLKLTIPIYRKVPVIMFDDTYPTDPFDRNGRLKPEVKTNTSYNVIQLMEFTPAFDYEKSVFETDDLFPEDVGFIERLVLKKPENGFPALFRIKENTGLLFVNEAAKNEIERLGFTGCVFEEVAVST